VQPPKPVVPKISVALQKRVAMGQKLGRAEAIQTADGYFQRYPLLLCLSVAWVLGETSRLPRLTPDLATFWQKSSTQLMTFSIHCLGLRSRGVHQTQIWVALKKVWEWLTLNVQIVLFKTNVGFQVFLQKLQLVKLYPLEIKPTARHSITTNRLIS